MLLIFWREKTIDRPPMKADSRR